MFQETPEWPNDLLFFKWVVMVANALSDTGTTADDHSHQYLLSWPQTYLHNCHQHPFINIIIIDFLMEWTKTPTVTFILWHAAAFIKQAFHNSELLTYLSQGKRFAFIRSPVCLIVEGEKEILKYSCTRFLDK